MNWGVGTAIKFILGLQVGIGAMLVLGDIGTGLQGLGPAPRAPSLTERVRPGDQTRRYRPDDLPADAPGRPFPPLGEMPPRLALSTETVEEAAVLRLVGEIAPGDAARVADLLREALADGAGPSTVYLHSPGGSVADALQLGRTLRDTGLSTAIAAGEVCLSACPYLLAAGIERRVDETGQVGVHQHYFGQNSVQPAFLAVEDIQRGQADVVRHLTEMGVDLRIMALLLDTPPDEIYVLLPDELTDFALATELLP